FQAEDGIRDRNVTGVQTCALPISLSATSRDSWNTDNCEAIDGSPGSSALAKCDQTPLTRTCPASSARAAACTTLPHTAGSTPPQIGRASCRERVEVSRVAGAAPHR